MSNQAELACAPLEGTGHNLCKLGRHGRMLFGAHDLHIGRSLDLYGEWAEQELSLLSSVLRAGDTALDVGANIGTHTLAFARAVGPTGRVFAFEPQRLVFQTLCANLALNGITCVDARQAAVADTQGSTRVPEVEFDKPQNVGGVSVGDQTGGVSVAQLAIDDLELDSVRLIKIDVEGFELFVLRGADKTIRAYRPALYVENNDAERSRSLIEHLVELDYSLYWHFSPFYNPANFYGNTDDVFGGLVDANMLCLPTPMPGLMPVEGPDDTAEAALRRN